MWNRILEELRQEQRMRAWGLGALMALVLLAILPAPSCGREQAVYLRVADLHIVAASPGDLELTLEVRALSRPDDGPQIHHHP